jgi:hypothetical protein
MEWVLRLVWPKRADVQGRAVRAGLGEFARSFGVLPREDGRYGISIPPMSREWLQEHCVEFDKHLDLHG